MSIKEQILMSTPLCELADRARAILAKNHPEWNHLPLFEPPQSQDIVVGAKIMEDDTLAVAMIRGTFYGPAFKVLHMSERKIKSEWGLIWTHDQIVETVMSQFLRNYRNL